MALVPEVYIPEAAFAVSGGQGLLMAAASRLSPLWGLYLESF